MAPGYYWARDRAETIEGVRIVYVDEFEQVWTHGYDFNFGASEWDFGPRVKGQDEDSEA